MEGHFVNFHICLVEKTKSRGALHHKIWRDGRAAEGGGLLNRYTDLNPYRGFESLFLRQIS